MSLEGLYREAQRDCIFRQVLLDRINLEQSARYVHEVRYFSLNRNKFNPEADQPYKMGTHAPWLTRNLGVKWLRSDVFVYDPAFTLSWPFFCSVLIDHEGYHAQEYFQKPDIIRTKHLNGCFEIRIQEAEREIRACQNQLDRAKFRGLSEEEIALIERHIADFGKEVAAQRATAERF